MITDRLTGQERLLADLFLPMFGEHNVQNSLTVLAVAEEMGLGDEVVRATLRNFKGVRRRFTKTGEWNGVTIIDDYGHHPVEIAAVLEGGAGDRRPGRRRRPGDRGRAAAPLLPPRAFVRRILHLLQRCRPGARRRCLCRPARRRSRARRARRWSPASARTAIATPGLCRGRTHLAPMLRELARPGDIVVCLGAGSITGWANSLPDDLAALDRRSRGSVKARAGILDSDWRRRLPPVRGRLVADAADRTSDLVPRRRSGRGAVPPGGRS